MNDKFQKQLEEIWRGMLELDMPEDSKNWASESVTDDGRYKPQQNENEGLKRK